MDDLLLALEAVAGAGALVLPRFRADPDVRHKAPGHPVTDADLAADRSLRDALVAARPDYGWLSEESADRPDRAARDRVWIVDPIDGTRSFVAGHPEFAISVGLVERGSVVLGVVHNPATGAFFWARRGAGARRTVGVPERADAGRPVAVRQPASPPVLLASRSEIAAGELEPFGDGWDVRPTGSTAYKLALVAAGRGDAFISRGPKSEWDVCAGALLVEEAGGRVTELSGAALRYNRREPAVRGIVAGSPAAHRRLLARVRTLPELPRLHRWSGDV